MAIGTGFGQVFKGIGQVGGVAISSAIFQSSLESELRSRIHRPDAEDVRDPDTLYTLFQSLIVLFARAAN